MPYRSKELNLTFNILAPGYAWFNTIMCRGFFELYSIDNDRKYIDDIEKSMIHAWSSSCHQGNNLLNDDDLRGGLPRPVGKYSIREHWLNCMPGYQCWNVKTDS